jgi:hypothetical protein
MEELGARHTGGFSLADLADRLGGIGELVGDGLERYGLIESDVEALVRWAVEWETDIRARLAAGESGPTAVVEDDWDASLDPS